MDAVVSSFASSLDDLDIELLEATAAEAPGVLDTVLESPVVGTSIEEIDLSLSDISVDVNTDPTVEELHAANTGITPAVSAIADYGSVVLHGTEDGEEPLSLYPETHVAVVAASTLYEDMASAFGDIADRVRGGESSHVIATGPSATADMGELVKGAHGPKSVEVLVVTDR